MKIIVISVTQYKEKDGIINAISHEGVTSFLARGILDPKNKFAPLNNYLTIADVELTESNAKYPSLKNTDKQFPLIFYNHQYYYLRYNYIHYIFPIQQHQSVEIVFLS